MQLQLVKTLSKVSNFNLFKDTQTKIMVMAGSAQADEFKYSTDPIWLEAWKDRIDPYINQYPSDSGNMIKFLVDNPDYTLYLGQSSGQ